MDRVLLFDVGGLRCALPALDVQEICRAVTILPLPDAPPSIEGVINYRGRMIPVLDTRRHLGREPRALALSDHLIIARAKDRLFALRVDAALSIERVEAIQPVEEIVRGARPIAGVARLADGMAFIRDLDSFVSDAELEAIAP